MNKSFSLYLDLLRGLAALTVVFYHYSNQVAEGVWANSFPNVGQEAVIVFFVLSGYVISFAADKREKSPVEFACKRISRIYSVYIPSIVVALACWYIIGRLGQTHVYNMGENLARPEKTLVLNFFFLNFNSFFPRVVLPGGGPYWSLTYEVFYYFLFFLFTYFRNMAGLAMICVLSIFLGAGPILLFPIWILGSIAYKINSTYEGVGRKLALVAVISSMVFLVVANVSGIRSKYLRLGDYLPLSFSPSYTGDFIYFYLIGAIMAVNLVAVYRLLPDSFMPNITMEKPIRFVAGVSFSLYLMHLPLMRLGEALFGDPFPYILPVVVSTLIILTCSPIERSNKIFFRYLHPLSVGLVERVRSLSHCYKRGRQEISKSEVSS